MSTPKSSATDGRHGGLAANAGLVLGSLLAVAVGLAMLTTAHTTRTAITQHHHSPCPTRCARAIARRAAPAIPATAPLPTHTDAGRRFFVDPGTGFAVEQRQPVHAVHTRLYRVNRGPGFALAAPH